jgi:MFS family permease
VHGTEFEAHTGRTVGVLVLAGILGAIMQTLVLPLLGELPGILHTTVSNASWVVTATLLSAAVATPVMGRLGDLYGKRRMLLVSTVPLIAGSVVAATATNLSAMVVGRGLQGISMSLVPLGISAMRDLLPPEKLNSSIALMSASVGIGGALALPFASAVIYYSNWRILFWTCAGLSLLVGVLIKLLVPNAEQRGEAKGKFDHVGAVTLGAGLVALLLAVSKGGDWGWGSGSILSLFAGTVVVLLLWGWFELRRNEPLVDLRIAARPQVLLTNVASLFIGFAMCAAALVVPQLMQLPEESGYGMGTSMLTMGLLTAPSGLMMMAVAPVGGKLSTRFGAKITLLLGSLVIALGYGFSVLTMDSVWSLVTTLCVINVGVGLAYGAMPVLIMSGVPRSATAAANGFNGLLRALGIAIGAAVVGVVFSQLTVVTRGSVLPSEDAFRIAMMLGGGAALAAAAITLTIPLGVRLARTAPPVPGGKLSPQGTERAGTHGGHRRRADALSRCRADRT